jgi:hypothetical protein
MALVQWAAAPPYMNQPHSLATLGTSCIGNGSCSRSKGHQRALQITSMAQLNGHLGINVHNFLPGRPELIKRLQWRIFGKFNAICFAKFRKEINFCYFISHNALSELKFNYFNLRYNFIYCSQKNIRLLCQKLIFFLWTVLITTC